MDITRFSQFTSKFFSSLKSSADSCSLVLFRKEVYFLPNMVFYYKQPFFFSVFSTTFPLHSFPYITKGSPRYLFFKAFWISTSNLSESILTGLSVKQSSFGSAIEQQLRLVSQLSPVNAVTPYKKRAWTSVRRKNSL